MESSLQISFRDVEPTPAIEQRVREHAASLERFFDRITSCHVVIESFARRHHKGRMYRVRLDLAVPGSTLVVDRDPAENHAHEDLYVALHDTFRAARRQLQDYARSRRREVKRHEGPAHARIVRLFPEDGYGFLATPDGREIYFHRNSVVEGSFERLEIGDEVRYAEEPGEQGPQASSLTPVSSRRPSS